VHEFSSDAGLEHSVSASASAEAKIGPDIIVEAGWHHWGMTCTRTAL
jgi:hypothetical protein